MSYNDDISKIINTDFNETPIQQINNDLNNNFQQNQMINQQNQLYNQPQYIDQNHPIMNIKQDDKIQKMFEEDEYKTIIKKYIKKIIIFLIVYIIFSLESVKSFIGKYITYINPDNKGNITITGIIIYGLILSIIITSIDLFLL
jgi:hypothetical protein